MKPLRAHLLVPILLLACRQDGGEQARPTPTPAAARTVPLEIVFQGLIGFVDDTQQPTPTLWALLVDARNPPAELPPCATGADAAHYEAHVAGIKLEGITAFEVVAGTRQPYSGGDLIPLADHDVVVEDGASSTFPDRHLTLLVDASDLAIVPATATPRPLHLASVRPALLGDPLDLESPINGVADALVGRVRLHGADTLHARTHEQTGCPARTFGFSASPAQCATQDGGSIDLAEEVKATRKAVTMVRLRLRKAGAERVFELEPAPQAAMMRLAFRNVLPSHLAGAIDGCPTGAGHFASYRWFHRLSSNFGTPQQNGRCAYVPCVKTGPSSSPKCPQPLLPP